LRDVLLKEARFLGQPRPPVYPRRARELEQQGTVVLHIRLDGQGSIVDVQVQTSSGFALLDEAALAAARNWRFQPPTRDGLPIDGGIVAVPVPFTLR
jgi:protein TonB